MKKIALLWALALMLPAWGDDAAPARLVETNSGKAVTFYGAVSPDGRYAAGWTLRPHNKKAGPIDWSLWNHENPTDFLNKYAAYLPGDVSDDDDYELINCIIDLKDKKLLQLPTKEVNYPDKHRGDTYAAWSPAGQGPRYALVQNDFHYATENLWLVTLDSGGMHQMDLGENLQKAVDPLIAEKRPLVTHSYETFFPVDPQDGTNRPVAFHGSTVTIPFLSDVPKLDQDDTQIEGTVTVKLPEGTVLKVSSDTPRDDPFKDIPDLVKADHELNQVYSQLSQKLPPKQREELKTQQLAWIDQRDADAAQATDTPNDANAKDTNHARNKSLLDSTRQRVTDLQDRLNRLH